jgi:hypothetical protein
MAQIQANPWQFTNADQATSAAISSIVNQNASILITTSVSHGIVQDQKFSIQSTTSFNGLYRAIAVPSATTILAHNRPQNFGAANGGAAGNVLSVAYWGGSVRAEQIFWQPSAASQQLTLTDVYGDVVWQPTASSAAPFGPFTYGKIFWIANGLVINSLPSGGTLQITVN